MSTYHVCIKNAGQKNHDFLLYAQKPDIGDGGVDVFQAAMANQNIPAGSNATFTFTQDLFVICGDGKLEHGVTIAEYQLAPKPIVLGKGGTPPTLGSTFKVFVQSDAAAFTDPQPVSSAKPGTFRVITGSDFNDKSNVYAGIASKNPSGTGHTVNATFYLEPSSHYSVRPKFVFFVATGKYKAGKLIDVGELGDPVEINFMDGTTTTSIIYNSDGTYSAPSYSNA